MTYYPGRWKTTTLERFEEKYIPEPMSGCWLWIGSKNRDGYGTFFVAGKVRKAARAALHIFRGFDLNSPLHTLHRCDIPACVNPDHLFVGTIRDNALDSLHKGRHALASRTACKNGHEFTDATTWIEIRGTKRSRHCRVCWKERSCHTAIA